MATDYVPERLNYIRQSPRVSAMPCVRRVCSEAAIQGWRRNHPAVGTVVIPVGLSLSVSRAGDPVRGHDYGHHMNGCSFYCGRICTARIWLNHGQKSRVFRSIFTVLVSGGL